MSSSWSIFDPEPRAGKNLGDLIHDFAPSNPLCQESNIDISGEAVKKTLPWARASGPDGEVLGVY